METYFERLNETYHTKHPKCIQRDSFFVGHLENSVYTLTGPTVRLVLGPIRSCKFMKNVLFGAMQAECSQIWEHASNVHDLYI